MATNGDNSNKGNIQFTSKSKPEKGLGGYFQGQNLKTPTFSYWVTKYQKQNTHLDSESAFITIEKQASLSCGNYEIVYPNGVTLRINTSNLSDLSTLLKLI